MPGLGRHEGHEALRAAYDQWKPRKPQRHLIINTLVTEWNEDEARATSDFVFLLLGEAGGPSASSGATTTSSTSTATRWRFHSRVGEFVTPGSVGQ